MRGVYVNSKRRVCVCENHKNIRVVQRLDSPMSAQHSENLFTLLSAYL